jgi:hypothetical protein
MRRSSSAETVFVVSENAAKTLQYRPHDGEDVSGEIIVVAKGLSLAG